MNRDRFLIFVVQNAEHYSYRNKKKWKQIKINSPINA